MPERMKLQDMIRPGPGRVAVLVDTKDQITPAGLYIPEGTARSIHESKPTQGHVVAIGSDDEDDQPALWFGLGDVVLFGKFSGTELKWVPDPAKAAERIVVLQFKDILAKFIILDEIEKVQVK